MVNKDSEQIGLLYEKMCWDGYRKDGMKTKGGKTVNNCVKDNEDEDLPEEDAEQCDGATKKTSSDRKGKKWMKCATQPDGSVKRIHWGQKGVRVTGKSGNTKRKKSFKARHNCSSAKKGSPQEAACGDW